MEGWLASYIVEEMGLGCRCESDMGRFAVFAHGDMLTNLLWFWHLSGHRGLSYWVDLGYMD